MNIIPFNENMYIFLFMPSNENLLYSKMNDFIGEKISVRMLVKTFHFTEKTI